MEVVKWLVFSKNFMSVPMNRTKYINFNCQFIIVQRTNSTTYQLTEMYVVKNRTFFQHFGLWNQGWINVDDSPFYSKRSNLSGIELTATVPEVCCKNNMDPEHSHVLLMKTDTAEGNYKLLFEISRRIAPKTKCLSKAD